MKVLHIKKQVVKEVSLWDTEGREASSIGANLLGGGLIVLTVTVQSETDLHESEYFRLISVALKSK